MIFSQPLLLISGSVLLLGALAYKLIHDYRFWKKEKHINHRKEWWRWLITALTCSPSISLFTLSSEFNWKIATSLSAAICALFIWLFFDGISNKMKGFNFWDTGTDDKEDAITDNFLQAIPLWTQIILKTFPLGILIYIYIKGL